MRSVATALLFALILTAGPAAADEAPDASTSGNRSWLAHRTTPPTLSVARRDPGPTPWRTGALLVVLALLGGGAFVLRSKRRGAVKRSGAKAITVEEAQRVGPKAHAVVARVGGRRVLLGVTDHAVSCLAWLDDEKPEEPVEAPEPEDEIKPPGFVDALRIALGRRDPAPEPAVEPALAIAERTQDRFVRSQPIVEVESQAAGLVRRLERLS